MALPVMTDLAGLDFALMGRPFYDGGDKSAVDMTGLDFALMGEPFVGNNVPATTTSKIFRSMLGVGF